MTKAVKTLVVFLLLVAFAALAYAGVTQREKDQVDKENAVKQAEIDRIIRNTPPIKMF